MMLTIIFIVPSYNNYPGGYAMKKMNVILQRRNNEQEIILKDIAEGVFSYPPSVHIDVYSAQTGRGKNRFEWKVSLGILKFLESSTIRRKS